jgi:chaperonin GroEL (HSP60 family)
VIIAAEYQKEIFDFLVRCRTTGFNMPTEDGLVAVRAPVLAIVLDTRSEYGMSRLHDLECALGAKALTTNNGKLMEPPNEIEDFRLLVGRSDSVLSKPHYIRIRGGGGSRAERDARIAEIEREIAASIDSSQHGVLEAGRIEMLRRRSGMLQGEMHVIRVGGDSYKEKRNRALIYEDAVMAVKNCIKHGITLGGNVSIYHAIHYNKKELLASIIETFNEGVHNIMINSTEAKLRKVSSDILDIIAEGSLSAFKAVFDNATRNKKFKKEIFSKIQNSDEVCYTFNLMNNKFEAVVNYSDTRTCLDSERIISIPDLLSPGNMDKEILRATFSILGLFLTSNQLITVLTKKDNKV